MTVLSVNLLGPFAVFLDDSAVQKFSTIKVRALLAYLAIEGYHATDRSRLAGLLWPDMLEDSARGNLRFALSSLRKTIGDKKGSAPLLLAGRRTLQLNPDALAASRIEVDVASFQRLHKEANERYQADDLPSTLQAATSAIDLYRGPFLDSFGDIDSPEFDEWVRVQRELLHRQMAELLISVSQTFFATEDYAQSVRYAQMLVDHEPWREESHAHMMNALWHNGQGNAAMQQFERCRRILMDELDVAPSPEITALYDAIRDNRTGFQKQAVHEPPAQPKTNLAILAPLDDSTLAANATPSSEKQHNLPPRLKPFFGRKRELAEIHRLLSQPSCRQLTLVGPGGMGKSILALEYARSQTGKFADGVWAVSLTSTTTNEEIPIAIAEALGIVMIAAQEPRERLIHHLHDKSLLMILDNFEHLSDHVQWVTDLLVAAPSISLLVTSRERLNLRSETVLNLEGLDLPASQSAIQNDEASLDVVQSSAVRLFLDCAQRTSSGFALNTENLAQIVQICRLTDGMPLGIELAAPWTRVLSCEEIHQSLLEGMELLSTTMPDVLERHRSIRAIFNESWRQISDDAKRLFAQLSVFRGTFELAAIRAVTDASVVILAELVDRCFIRKTEDQRYTLHELMSQFGAEKLATSTSAQDEVAKRHATYYLEFLHQLEKAIIGQEQVATVQLIDRNMDNIRAAWRYAVEWRNYDLLEIAAPSLFRYFDNRGLAYESVEIFDDTCNALINDEALPPRLLARLRNYICANLLPLGRFEECQNLLSTNLDLTRENNLINEMGWSKLWLGWLKITKNPDEARLVLEESVQLFQQTEDEEGVIRALIFLSHWGSRQMVLEPALTWAMDALALARRFDAPLLVASCMEQLGLAYLNRGNRKRISNDLEQARTYFEDALLIVRMLNNQLLEADYTGDLGLVAAYEKDYVESRALVRQSVDLFRQVGLETGQALIAQDNLARLEYILGDFEAATTQFEGVAQKSQKAQNDLYSTRSLHGLAFSLLKQGKIGQAREAVQTVLRIGYIVGDQRLMPEFLIAATQLLMAEGSYANAALLFAYTKQNYDIDNGHMYKPTEIQMQLQEKLGVDQYQLIAANVDSLTMNDALRLVD